MEEIFWLGLGDVHNSFSKVLNLPDLNKAQGVIISGDLTNRGNKAEVLEFLQQLKKQVPVVFAQIGNMDSKEVEEALEEVGVNLHRKVVYVEPGLYVAGMGYSTPTPFGTPSEVSEQTLATWLGELKSKVQDKSPLLFVSHTPPYGTRCDTLFSGAHVGSKAVLDFIQEVAPDICLTGHIHEARSVDEVGSTLVINPGTLATGGYVKIIFQDGRLEVETSF